MKRSYRVERRVSCAGHRSGRRGAQALAFPAEEVARRGMLERELFALLEQTADAAYTVTEGGEICSWNGAAERLFGYAPTEVVGRNIDEVFAARDTLGTEALAGGAEAATRRWDGRASSGIANFDLE